jgi:hypothetical protein
MKKLTRDRVVPIISASVSWLKFPTIGSGLPSLPKFASRRRSRALDGIGLEDVGVEVISSPARRMRLDPSGEALRPQATMDLPFVKIGALLSKQRCLRE